MNPLRRAHLIRHQMATSCMDIATRPPASHLRPYVLGEYCGYTETSPGPLHRREFPRPQVAVIFEFGPPIRVFDRRVEGRSLGFKGGFVAGMADGYTGAPSTTASSTGCS